MMRIVCEPFFYFKYLKQSNLISWPAQTNTLTIILSSVIDLCLMLMQHNQTYASVRWAHIHSTGALFICKHIQRMLAKSLEANRGVNHWFSSLHNSWSKAKFVRLLLFRTYFSDSSANFTSFMSQCNICYLSSFTRIDNSSKSSWGSRNFRNDSSCYDWPPHCFLFTN